jgi:hypothetical protein
MTREDRTKAVLDLLNELDGLDHAKRERRRLEISLEDHFAILDHDATLEQMQSRMDTFPCQNNGFLTFFSSLSKGKQLMSWIAGAIFALFVAGGAVSGFLMWWRVK